MPVLKVFHQWQETVLSKPAKHVRPHVLGNTHDRTGSICVYVQGGGGKRWVPWGIMQKERTHPDFRTPKVSISAILPPSFGLTSLS